MSKQIILKPHHTTLQLHKLYRDCRKPNEKLRWRALFLISNGLVGAEAARRVGRTSGWITQLVQRYNLDGFSVVADRRDPENKTGCKPTLAKKMAVELEAALHGAAPDGGHWTAKKVAIWIEQKTGRQLHEASAWRILRSLGFTLQTAFPSRQKRWKKKK